MSSVEQKRKIVLKNKQAPGDAVMLTAALRDLHRSNPNVFETGVDTQYPDLWMNNPRVAPLGDPEAEMIMCEYPLIHRSNDAPFHFIHGFMKFLETRLDVRIEPSLFQGDIHLSLEEKRQPSPIAEMLGRDIPYWLIGAGGKNDSTIKWWDHERYQKVVDHFKGRILFVQVGAQDHYHPALNGVIDLRGKTTIRQLINLTHHAEGVLCPVTFFMHLAAAVPARRDRPPKRPCVVVAGGRESSHWEAYPHHQFLHTVGSISCCKSGGCWKARTVKLNDYDIHDLPEHLCLEPVMIVDGRSVDRSSSEYICPLTNGPGSRKYLPRCMDMITYEDVARHVEFYFLGGVCRYLTKVESETVTDFLTVRA